MGKCWLCKGVIYAALAVALYLVINALLTGGALAGILSTLGVTGVEGKTGFALWTAFITWCAPAGASVAIKSALGYKVFAAILALGAAAVFALADIIAWLVCLLCQAMGACDECEKPAILR
jgi:hypothetical protein